MPESEAFDHRRVPLGGCEEYEAARTCSTARGGMKAEL